MSMFNNRRVDKENHPNSALSYKDRADIAELNGKMSAAEAARIWKVSPDTIRRIWVASRQTVPLMECVAKKNYVGLACPCCKKHRLTKENETYTCDFCNQTGTYDQLVHITSRQVGPGGTVDDDEPQAS